jgi:hypothetical protein
MPQNDRSHASQDRRSGEGRHTADAVARRDTNEFRPLESLQPKAEFLELQRRWLPSIVLQNYFEQFGEKYFKVRLERATTIQKNRRSDSIVTNFYFTEPAWRRLQHNPLKSRHHRVAAFRHF